MQEKWMREQFARDKYSLRRGELAAQDLDADWSYLRANLDHPAHRPGNRLASGLAEWLLRRLHTASAPAPQLSILARIALGPRQSLTLVEAEGVHLLVGTSGEGSPSFFSLGHGAPPATDSAATASANIETDTVAPASYRGRLAGSLAATIAASRAQSAAPGQRQAVRPRLTGRVSWV